METALSVIAAGAGRGKTFACVPCVCPWVGLPSAGPDAAVCRCRRLGEDERESDVRAADEKPPSLRRHSTRSFPERKTECRTDGRTNGPAETETDGLNCRWDSFLSPSLPPVDAAVGGERTDGWSRTAIKNPLHPIRALGYLSTPHLFHSSDNAHDGTPLVIRSRPRWRNTHTQQREPGRRGKSAHDSHVLLPDRQVFAASQE